MYIGTVASPDTVFPMSSVFAIPYTKSLLSAIPLPDPHYEKQRQRISYVPLKEHDYTVDKPSFREVAPGHFVHCNDAEFARYKEQMKGN